MLCHCSSCPQSEDVFCSLQKEVGHVTSCQRWQVVGLPALDGWTHLWSPHLQHCGRASKHYGSSVAVFLIRDDNGNLLNVVKNHMVICISIYSQLALESLLLFTHGCKVKWWTDEGTKLAVSFMDDLQVWKKEPSSSAEVQLWTLQCYAFPLIRRSAASSTEIFEPAGCFPTSYLVVAIYCCTGSVCPLPSTSSPPAAVDGSVAGPSLSPLSVSQKCLGCGQVAYSVWELPRAAGSYNCKHGNGCPAALGFAFSFSQCLLTAIDPNRARSCCLF